MHKNTVLSMVELAHAQGHTCKTFNPIGGHRVMIAKGKDKMLGNFVIYPVEILQFNGKHVVVFSETAPETALVVDPATPYVPVYSGTSVQREYTSYFVLTCSPPIDFVVTWTPTNFHVHIRNA